MTQPTWKLLWATDTEALYVDETGEHEPELAILHEYETERGTMRYLVFRFGLERYKIVADREDHADGTATTTEYLVPYAYEPATWKHPVSGYVPWFADDLASIAVTSGSTPSDLIRSLCAEDPSERSEAYRDIAGHFGPDEFDQYPQDLTPSAVANWPELEGKPRVTISVSDDDTGNVTLYCNDQEAARDAQSVLGSHWESPRDMDVAYASVMDRADLVEALEAEGYDVDASEWSAPDAQDFAYWAAKYEHSNGATPDRLREILGWHTLADVAACRRVQDAIQAWWTNADQQAYIQACAEACFPLDGEKWHDARYADEETIVIPTDIEREIGRA